MTHTTADSITLTGADIASLRRLIETHPVGDARLQDVLDEHYHAAEHDRPSRDDDESPFRSDEDWADASGLDIATVTRLRALDAADPARDLRVGHARRR